MTDPIRKRDIVEHRDDAAPKPPRGIVMAMFAITDRDMLGIWYTPVEPGDYAVVMWHNRKTLRVEPAGELVKVGYLDYP